MAYIKLFFASNDVQVSAAPTTTNAVSFTLRADQNESDSVRLYALADSGYTCTGVEVTPTGTSNAKWAFAPDVAGSPGTYGSDGAKITLGAVGPSTKVYFHARAKSSSDETPVNDTSVTLVVSGIAAAV